MATKKPPRGVPPYRCWAEDNPEPDVTDLAQRFVDVYAAVRRYWDAGLPCPQEWLVECGMIDLQQRIRWWR